MSRPNLPDEPSLDLSDLALPDHTREAIAAWLREPVYADVRPELQRTVRAALGGAVSPGGPGASRAQSSAG